MRRVKEKAAQWFICWCIWAGYLYYVTSHTEYVVDSKVAFYCNLLIAINGVFEIICVLMFAACIKSCFRTSDTATTWKMLILIT